MHFVSKILALTLTVMLMGLSSASATPFAEALTSAKPVFTGTLISRIAVSAKARFTPGLELAQRPAPPPIGHGAFESVPIPVGNIALAGKWTRAVERDHTGFFTADCEALGFDNCTTAFASAGRETLADAQGLSQVAMLRLVNQRINHAITYASDVANWGVGDRWATPSEVARNGKGDCEDYAIAKMWLLRALGFSESQLQVVVLQDTSRQLYHAVLVAHVGGFRYILDNLSNTVRLDSQIPNYLPLVSFVADKTFLHGFDQRRIVVAMPADLSGVRPGEGV